VKVCRHVSILRDVGGDRDLGVRGGRGLWRWKWGSEELVD
jgi:hypothetical protein